MTNSKQELKQNEKKNTKSKIQTLECRKAKLRIQNSETSQNPATSPLNESTLIWSQLLPADGMGLGSVCDPCHQCYFPMYSHDDRHHGNTFM